LTGDPYRPEAVAAARQLKGYDAPRPFLCLVQDAGAARGLASEWPAAAERLAAAFWPGPLTLVVRSAAGAPEAVARAGAVAVRPASDPVSRALLAAWGGPLFSTSANRRAEPAPVAVEEAVAALGGTPGSQAIALGLVDAEAPAGALGRPSSIVDLTGPPRLVRPGAISLARLREVAPELVVES
jgi:L-threonylcarbamoyladenylate synthase